MNRINIILQSSLLIAVIVLIVKVWPLTNQSTAQIAPVSSQSNSADRGLPEPARTVLSEVEKSLSAQSSWPNSREEVEKLQGKLRDVLNALSPVEQELALPRLVPIRWEIQALWLLAKENEPSDSQVNEAKALADEIELLNGSAPAESSEELRKLLKKKEQELREKAAKQERSLAMERGRNAVSGKGSGVDLDQVIRQLALFDDDEARRLGYQLAMRKDLDTVLSDLEQLEKLTDATLKEYGLAKLSQSVMDLRLRLALNMAKLGSPERAAERLSSLEKSISGGYDKIVKVRRSEAVKKTREYQTWALAQIKLVPSLDSLKEAEVVKIPSALDRHNRFSDAYKGAEERAMNELDRLLISKMAPINQSVLDDAVSTWYRKIFQDRFDSLNEAHKLKVVTAFAASDKRLIDQ